MMRRGNQPARQWCLLQVLGRLPGLAGEDPARELGCLVRMVWRDLRMLLEVFRQWTHAGRGTTFGLGRYRIRPDSAGGECGV